LFNAVKPIRFARQNSIVKKLFIFPIRVYQAALSPLLGQNCRHVPSCSEYTAQAIQEWGVAKGIYLGTKRIAKCHPWGTSGYDPVPKKTNAKTT
jgi:putative membrane protein insertion efficiency factor